MTSRSPQKSEMVMTPYDIFFFLDFKLYFTNVIISAYVLGKM